MGSSSRATRAQDTDSAETPAPRSLAADLRTRGDDDLEALLRARPDLASPVPSDIGQLASRATTRASVVRALDRLDRFTLQVVDALAVLPEPTAAEAIRDLLGVPLAEVRRALATLRAQALVWGAHDDIKLVRVIGEIVGPFPAGVGPPLRQALLSYPPARLATIAVDLGFTAADDAPADVDAIAERITAQLADLLAELGDDAVAALGKLAAGPPSGRVENAERVIDRGSARSPIDRLLASGLIVPTGAATVVLPREIAIHLRGGVLHPSAQPSAPPLATTQHEPDTVDRTAAASAFDTVRRVGALLDAWSTEPPAVLRTGGLGVRELRRIPDLLHTDESGAALITELAYSAGLLTSGGASDEVWLPTPAFDAWSDDTVAGRWTTLVDAWRTTSRAPGLVGARDERDRLIPPLGHHLDRPLAPEVRALVLNTLAGLPPGAAPDPDDVRDVVRWRRPRRGGQLRDDLVRWTLREAETIGLTGHGPLASYVRPLLDGRPRDAVAALEMVLPEPLDHVLLQADLTAVAPGPLRSDLARELAAMTDVESRGGASVHRFTPESVRRALDEGRTAAELHAFVARVSRTPVPQPLTYLIDDVARRHGHLRVGAASSHIRCDDEDVLAEILAHSAAVSLGARRIAPTVIASELDPSSLLERLRRMGFTPVPEAADGSVVIARAEPRRAPGRRSPTLLMTERPPPSDSVITAAVRAVRAGDRSAARRPADAVPARLGRTASAQTLADLRRALEEGTTVWIGYVDQHGATSERVIDPVRLDGGWLAAFDHRSGEVRSFAVHRISGVASVDAPV
jgi:hypothetical protein